MDENHITDRVHDYVLGLLEPAERTAVEAHVAHCATCRVALQRERALVQLLRETASAVPQLPEARLRQLMPRPPQRRLPLWERLNLGMPRSMQKQFVALAFVAVLLISTLGLQMFGDPHAFTAGAGEIRNSTSTDTPVATLPAGTNSVALAPTQEPTAVVANTALATEPAVVQTANIAPEPAPLAATPVPVTGGN